MNTMESIDLAVRFEQHYQIGIQKYRDLYANMYLHKYEQLYCDDMASAKLVEQKRDRVESVKVLSAELQMTEKNLQAFQKLEAQMENSALVVQLGDKTAEEV